MDCKCPCDYYVRTMNILMQTTTTKKIYTENTRVLECCFGVVYIAVTSVVVKCLYMHTPVV